MMLDGTLLVEEVLRERRASIDMWSATRQWLCSSWLGKERVTHKLRIHLKLIIVIQRDTGNSDPHLWTNPHLHAE